MITRAARNLDLYFSGTAEEKLKVALNIYSRQGNEIIECKNINKTLSRLSDYEKILTNQMNYMEMGSRCSICAAKSGGCCSDYMSANSDAILLLVNMLLEVDVVYHYNQDECCFLGRSGCVLTIKPIFCLNYNCFQINESYPARQIRKLEKFAGQLLGEQIILEDMLLDYLENQ